jgi:phospholipid/cholesterol/gamma-HCH transport system substrate-binding protein
MRMYFRIRHVDRYVGFFVILGMALAIFILVLAARGQKWFAERSPYRVVFQKVQGIKPGTPVTISGMEVGRVKNLHLTPQAQVELTLEVLQSHRQFIRQDSRATIASELLGGKSIEILPGTAGQPLLKEGGTIPSIEPKELTDLLKGIDVKAPLKKLDEALENAKSITARLNDPRGELFTLLRNVEFLSAQLKNGQGSVGAILQDQKMHGEITATLAALRRSAANAEEATRNAAQLSRQLPEIVEDVRRTTAEFPALMRDVKKAAADAPAITGNAREITQDVKTLAKDAKVVMGSVKKAAPEIPDFVSSTHETVDDADKLILGLQHHWLLRGSMPKPQSPRAIEMSQRESPYGTTGGNSQ